MADRSTTSESIGSGRRRTCRFPENSIAGVVCREAVAGIAVSDTVLGG
jgi:hypothetical protein